MTDSTGITLTDHFKQALNQTRSQLQYGPNAMLSATQMGLVPGGGGLGSGGSGVGVYGGGGGGGGLGITPPPPPTYFGTPMDLNTPPTPGFFESYGKWIFILFVILGSIAFWWWWKNRQSQLEKMKNNTQRPLRIPTSSHPMQQYNQQQPQPPPQFVNPMLPVPQHINLPLQQFNPPPPQTHLNSPQNPPSNNPRDIREREQQIGSRGADYNNPNLTSSNLVPISSRLDTSGQGTYQPPLPLPPPQQQPQMQQQQMPPPQMPPPQMPPPQQQQMPPPQQQPQYVPQPTLPLSDIPQAGTTSSDPNLTPL